VLLRDRDDRFGPAFDRVAQGAGTEVIRTAVRAPNMNSVAERLSRVHVESCSTTCCSPTMCTSRLCFVNTSATSMRVARTKGLANACRRAP
jgi:hypothetical protein